ncbi:MAG: hypothetical protein ACI9V1_002415 [Spirosomataceae bacterium]|jgi:Ca2+-binding EF-hand superfamily protein
MKKLIITALSFLALNFAASSCGNKKAKPQVERLFTQMDVNKGGELSKNEVKGPLLDDFLRIDANSNGFLTEEEVAAAAPRNGNGQGRPPSGQEGPPNKR